MKAKNLIGGSMSYFRVLLSMVFMVSSLISCGGAPIIEANPEQLHIVAQSGDVAEVDTLLKTGKSVDQIDGHGVTPLIYAISSSQVAMVEYLLSKGADPNYRADNGETPLLVAVKKGSLPIVELLLREGVQIDTVGEDGFTALTIATENGDKPIFDQLLAKGANPDTSLPGCDTALIKAFKQVDTYYFDRLIGAGADPNHKGQNGNTPLILAVYNLNLEKTSKLLGAGSHVNDVNEAGYGALTFATGLKNIDPDIIRLLLEKGADVNQAAKDGLTPLRAACLSGHKDIAAYLFQNGAIPDFSDATDEGIHVGINLKHILGDYFLAADDLTRVRDFFSQAQSDNSKLSEKYKGDVTTLAWKQAGTVAGIVGLAIAGSAILVLSEVINPGSSTAAMIIAVEDQRSGSEKNKSQAENNAQVSGETTPQPQKIAIQGYEAYEKKYNQAFVPTYQPIDMVFKQPPEDKSSVFEKKAYADEKAREFEEKAAYMGKILECFDKHPGGQGKLHMCVNTIVAEYTDTHAPKQQGEDGN